ncbi:hypothetical protein SC029_10460 [Legionella pneumophila serogroup 1]|uniref:hypothetical protein n=1 Tax=Legionella pneumophila TaxID=446 RepID=UPI0001E3C7EC|nr:hypothetical protein [Legionella pneumophila]HAT9040182.1 hypothetical protein [Legionella pneumophila subsp. pneumophila]TIE22780.1 hypothetical protein DIZ73_18540 [Legionella pneumophila]TIE29293.1 hypothetical protein DIZ48_03455 [Legionella pneumophila]TIE50798.1 hypothetical protein DIZ50_03455 [Legionella pneumophila]WBV72396.1 hypothetical protein PGH42_05350 [Legionella pneumophila]
MNLEEVKKLERDILECFGRYNEALKKVIDTLASPEAIKELEKIDEEFKVLNKQLWDWVGS